MSSTPYTLRDRFPPVPTSSWIRAIKSTVPDPESLHWIGDGVEFRPFYRASDTLGASRSNSVPGWELCQQIDLTASDSLAGAVKPGSMAVHLRTATGTAPYSLHSSFQQLLGAGLAVHWSGPVRGIPATMLSAAPDPSAVRGSLLSDPLTTMLSGRIPPGYDDLPALLAEPTLPDLRTLAVDATVFMPMNVTAQIACALGATSEILAQMTGRGIPASEVAAAISVRVGVSTSFFVEIAKLRALRHLLRQAFAAYDAHDIEPHIFVEPSALCHSSLDPELNVARASTQSLSAILGGCDTLCVPPLPALPVNVALHLQLVLDHEARCGWTADPMHGSYLVEHMTGALGRAAWARFRETEAAGGLWRDCQNGKLQSLIANAMQQRQSDINTHTRKMVGVNTYCASQVATTGVCRTGYAHDFENIRRRLGTDPPLGALVGDDPAMKSLAIRLMESLGLQWEEASDGNIPSASSFIVTAGTPNEADMCASADIPVIAVLPSEPDAPVHGATQYFFPGKDIPSMMTEVLDSATAIH